jgi:paraquat-inducible protein B
MMGEVPDDLRDTLKTAQSALAQAENTFISIRGVTEDTKTLSYEVNRSLKELSAAALSIRLLADYLERHPESLTRGKRDYKGD